MEEITITYEGINKSFKCNKNDKMKDIINKFSEENKIDNKDLRFLYNEKEINQELTFNEQANESDKNKNKINIIAKKNKEDINEENKKISKDIICPECHESALINIKDFKVNLYGCKNGHQINNILLNKYEEIQKVDLTKIICNLCNKNNKFYSHNNEFFICCTCNKNICSSCNSNHDKNHIIIKYDDKKYICNKHKESFIQYCVTCKENICIICEKDHNNHNILYLGKILLTKNEMLKTMENLKNAISKFKNKIKIMKEILDKTINILDTYYSLNNEIVNNYDVSKRNYNLLQNLNYLNTNNAQLTKEIDDVINNDKVYEFSIDNFYNDYGEKYIGEIKNKLMEGKGILYYNKDNINNYKRYEGEFKNGKKEGKGIIYYKNGDKYVGDWKDDLREGKGILYYNSGRKYEGDWKNNEKVENYSFCSIF